ncbi:hypothetical protein KUW19_18220 [Ferrimonas balearica]|uniref:hypothetical protein n=1 Tax=Ferrimonas balearica TaxID=44012 RepID=UPI001C97997F|nr:hypothetical protein [Ferrimonas balearica]MBY6108400.1 hypothetical protein [Ferrimonas balearica]
MKILSKDEIKKVSGGAWWTRVAIGVASAYIRSCANDGGWFYNDGEFRRSNLL